ncbi:46272_t:CDS:2 [Gigaspora margarita]|uniref:46272_t:CDS:1 n=1 Tax=Gigaspora margarita TaxID=4874 RepID=A0ABN7VZ51_GIGMA|nr:46272_t:CDS:2 [Gigaspora margarita]
MTYTATELEKSFKKVARIRHGKEYENDAGGSHSLPEDCQTFANAFNKISNLRDIKEELKKCTSKNEYEAKKNNFLRQCDEALNGLHAKTSSSSSMFGVFQELKELELEINQITQRMEENKRKAMSETDPTKKAALIQAIEEDGLLLQQRYKKKQELSNKFNFDPKKKVDDLIESMKKAIKKGKKKSPDGSGGGRQKEPSADNNSSSDESSDDDNINSPSGKKEIKTKLGEYTEALENQLETYQRGLILITLALLLLFVIYQLTKKETPAPRELTSEEKREIESLAEQRILKRAEFLRKLQGQHA